VRPSPPSLPALGAARWLVPDVVPVGYAEEPRPMGGADTTPVLLRAIELSPQWWAAIALFP